MSEVFSTGVAMLFDTPIPNKNAKNEKKAAAESKKPKLSPEEFSAKLRSKLENVISQDGGQYMEFPEGIGLLVAGAVSDNKYYFVWLDRDRKIKLTRTLDTFHVLKEIPVSMSITDWLLRHEAGTLRCTVERFFELEATSDDPARFEKVGEINLGRRAGSENRDTQRHGFRKKGGDKKRSNRKDKK